MRLLQREAHKKEKRGGNRSAEGDNCGCFTRALSFLMDTIWKEEKRTKNSKEKKL